MGKPEKVSIELDSDAIAAATAAGLDLSQELMGALRRKLPALQEFDKEDAARRWYEENKEAVDWHNRFVEEHGLFSDGLRKF